MRPFRSLTLVAVGLLPALLACGKEEEAAPPIELATAERRTITVDAEATGVVEPIAIVEIKSRASGQITALPVETGSLVRPGDLLAQLDTREMRNQFDQADADLKAAEARLAVARAQRDRTKSLFDQQVITSQELEASSLELENAQAAMVRARTNVDLARQRLEDATVTAPSAGTVIARLVAPGQVIVSATSSASGGTTLMNMADLGQVRVRALVNESDIGKIRTGQVARVTVDAYPNRPFVGQVEKVEPQAIIDQSVTMFPVLVTLDNGEGLLMPGMNGEVSVLVDRRQDVVTVPVDAIRTMRDAVATGTMLGLVGDSVQAAIRTQMGALMRGPEGGAPAAPGADAAGQPVRTRPAGAGAAARGEAAPDVRLTSGRPGEAQEPAGAPARQRPARGAAGDAPAAAPADGQGAGAAAGGRGGRAGRGGWGGMGGGRRRGNGTPGIVFVAKGQTYEPRVVLMGASDYDHTEIIRGLEAGEQVALLAGVALQAQRQEMQDRIRQRTSMPGMSRQSGGTQSGSGGAGGGR